MDSKAIRKDGTRTGLIIIANQVVFQAGTLIMLFLAAFLFGRLGIIPGEGTLSYISSDIMQLIAGVILLVFYLRNRNEISAAPMEKRPCSAKVFLKYLAAVFAVNMAVSAIDYILQLTTDIHLAGESENIKENPVIMLIFIGIFPAITEELIYRGIIYRYLRKHGTIFAAAMSSLIFGLIHMNFVQLAFAGSMGFMLCLLYEKTGRMRYGMLIHFLNNSLMAAFLYIPVSEDIKMYIQIFSGAISIFVLLVLAYRKRNIMDEDTIAVCKSFMLSIPMIILAIGCVAGCMVMITSSPV